MAVKVVCGANSQDVDLAGKSVAEARKNLAGPLNIPKDAQAMVKGKEVANNHQLQDGETLEFVKPAGSKG